MDTTAAPATQPPAAFDDVWIPPPPLPQISGRERYDFWATVDNEAGQGELNTHVYITADSADRRSPQEQAAEWIRKTQADPKAKFKLVEQGAVSLPGVPLIRGQDDKIVREPYRLEFESYSVQEHSNPQDSHGYGHRYIQRFYFLPVSAEWTVVTRQVRRLKDDSPNSAFWKQWQHFLATLKVETASATSSIAGSGPRLRRYYTAHLSFEIPTGDDDTGNQWAIGHGTAKRSETWRTPQGDINVGYGIIGGYTFSVAQGNKDVQQTAKDLVANLAGAVRALNPSARVGTQTYLQKKVGAYDIYGHKDVGTHDTEIELDLAYKTGKEFGMRFAGPTAAMTAAEPAIYAWLAQLRFLP